MKKLHLILLLALATLSAQAQTIGEAFYIYRNDGQFNAFFRDEIDSIAYSHYDADSIYYHENVTQLVYTADSLYRIPLAAIDSVGFVQPETIYREGTVPLTGELFDYLIKAEDMRLTFSAALPSGLIPKVDDKLVAAELSEKLPYGFVGKVRNVENDADGIAVYCDSLALEDAVSQFYSTLEIVSDNGSSTRRYLNRRAPAVTDRWPIDFKLPKIIVPIDLSRVFAPKKVFGKGGKADFDISIVPTVTGRIVRVVDDKTGLSCLIIHAVTDYQTTTDIDLAGIARSDFDFVNRLWVHKDIPGPWGIPVYFAFGPILEIGGELAFGATVNADFRHTADITFYPATAPYYLARMNPLVRALFQITGIDQMSKQVNTVDHDFRKTRFDAEWEYFAARGNITAGVAGRIGVALPTHDVAWVGCEAQGGIKGDAEFNVDFDDFSNAERGTGFYESLKNNSHLTIKPYWGIQAVVSGLKDKLQVKFGRDDYTLFDTKLLDRSFLPVFSDTKAMAGSGASAEVSADIDNDCLFPWTVGFSLFDENNNRIGEPQWNNQKYCTKKDFSLPMKETFTDLDTDKNYKVYPTLNLFGIPVLASPSADLAMHCPVTLSDFRVTSAQHQENGFSHNGQTYDYSYNVTVTATLDADAEGIAEWGYIYLDPNGDEARIPLSQFGHSYPDSRYAYYRNSPHATCTLYGYVRYEGSNDIVRGERHDFPLDYQGETSCPDASHPHWIDLGLPSGTQWRCCNEGASAPETYGGYYTFGQVGSAPSLDQIRELLSCCSYTWTTQNGVNGGKFTGPNGGTIFLPAAGGRWGGELLSVGSWGDYWSSTPHGEGGAHVLYFGDGSAGWSYDWSRYNELSVRPVR